MRTVSHLLLGSIISAAAFSSACGGGGSPRPDTNVLVIGAGAEDGTPGFLEMTDGQEMMLQPGAQGGFHVFLNIRVDEVDMNPTHRLYIDREARRESTNQLVSTNKQRALFTMSAEAGYYDTEEPFRMFLCPTPIEVPVRDEMLVVTILAFEEQTDEEPKAAGTIRLRPRCREDSLEFCLRICSG